MVALQQIAFAHECHQFENMSIVSQAMAWRYRKTRVIARVLREIGYVREMGEGMRRIFLLMRDADLVPPVLTAEPNRFKITLCYKSVFSEMDQKWLDEFRPLKLTREEMLIALLGKNGNLLSPRQIYDRLDLVDWDVYRMIVDQIQTKGILFNAISQNEKVNRARKQRVSQRDIPRLAVRQPEELEKALSELLVVLQNSSPATAIDKVFVTQVLARLPHDNPYHTNIMHLDKLLKLLGFVDEESPQLLC